MAKSKRITGGVSEKRASWIDADDAPPLGADFFAKAQLHKGGRPARGRPKLENRKLAVSLRLDPDVVAAYKAKGEGWQTLINADLRKVAGLSASGKGQNEMAAKGPRRVKERSGKRRI